MYIKVDGREFSFPDLDELTFEEASLIKQHTGLRLGEMGEALKAGDSDGLLAILIIEKLRTDGEVDIAALKKLKLSSVEVITDDEEKDADPSQDAATPGAELVAADEGEAA